jgi:hypothetical protein
MKAFLKWFLRNLYDIPKRKLKYYIKELRERNDSDERDLGLVVALFGGACSSTFIGFVLGAYYNSFTFGVSMFILSFIIFALVGFVFYAHGYFMKELREVAEGI